MDSTRISELQFFIYKKKIIRYPHSGKRRGSSYARFSLHDILSHELTYAHTGLILIHTTNAGRLDSDCTHQYMLHSEHTKFLHKTLSSGWVIQPETDNAQSSLTINDIRDSTLLCLTYQPSQPDLSAPRLLIAIACLCQWAVAVWLWFGIVVDLPVHGVSH